jgi:hypothetical protein
MKKIIRLTENDLIKLVKRVIKEQTQNIRKENRLLIGDFETPTWVGKVVWKDLRVRIDKRLGKPNVQRGQGFNIPELPNGVNVLISSQQITSSLTNYLNTILGLSLSQMKGKLKYSKGGVDFNSINTQYINSVLSPLLDGLGVPPEPTQNDIDRFLQRRLPEIISQNPGSLLELLNKHKINVSKFTQNIEKQGVTGFDMGTSSYKNLKMSDVAFNDTLSLILEISIENRGATSENDFKTILNNVYTSYSQYIENTWRGDSNVINIPSLEGLLEVDPRLASKINENGGVKNLNLSIPKIVVKIETINPGKFNIT